MGVGPIPGATLERSVFHGSLGTRADAFAGVGFGPKHLYVCIQIGEYLGWTALLGRLCIHSCISGIWATDPHGYCRNVFCASDVVEFRFPLAITFPLRRFALWGPFWFDDPLKILRWHSVVCFYCLPYMPSACP